MTARGIGTGRDLRPARSWRGWAFAALAACALAVVGVNDASARGSRRQAAGYEKVALELMRENPRAFVGKRVSFDCFFAQLGRIYQPFQTPFVADQFLNFYVWEPETRLWDDRERKDAFLFCFVPRDLDEQASYIMSRRMYDSVRLYGNVNVAYAGQPWFELEDIEPSDARNYTELALKHILVGIKSLKNEDFRMAQESFEEARDTGLPRTAETFVQRELGSTYYELGKYLEAGEAFEKAGKMDAWLALRRGQSLSRAAGAEREKKKREKMLRQALNLLKTARQLEPAKPEAHAEIGWVRAKLGKPREGILDCKRANALRESASTYRILGKIYYMIRKPADAYNNYQRAIMLAASVPKYHKELADLYMKQGKFEDAVTEYTNVVTLTGTEPDGYLLRAEAYKRLGLIDEATRDYEAARSQASENVEALLGLASCHSDKRDYKRARHWIGQAMLLAPDSIPALAASAQLLRSQGALADATAGFRRIIKEHPKADLTEAYYGLGEALSKKADKGDLGEAAKALEKAVRLAPEHVKARKVLAEVYAAWSKYSQAVEHLRAAKEIEPGDERTRLLYADALAEAGQVDEALKELAALINERPESTYAKNNRAYLLAEFGRKTDLLEAKELAQEAYDRDKANPVFQDTLGWVKYKLEDKDEGRLLVEQATIKSKGPDAFYHLAVIAFEAEPPETVEARSNVEEAIRLLNEKPGGGYVTGKLRDEVMALARKVGASLKPGARSQ